MLLPDLGYPIRFATEEEKIEAILRYGELQRKSIAHTEELLGIGCSDRRLVSLNPEIEMLVNMDRSRSGLDKREAEQLRAIGPRLKAMVDELADYNVPDTVSHNDLHLGNIAWCDGRFQFFDWGQGSVSHPFLDAGYYAEESELKSFPKETYLALWTNYAPMDRLEEAWDIARHLATLNFTLDQFRTSRHIRQEPEEFTETLTGHLKNLIDVVRQSNG
jgi:hypothetical protein